MCAKKERVSADHISLLHLVLEGQRAQLVLPITGPPGPLMASRSGVPPSLGGGGPELGFTSVLTQATLTRGGHLWWRTTHDVAGHNSHYPSNDVYATVFAATVYYITYYCYSVPAG